jgi:hypothetical protein
MTHVHCPSCRVRFTAAAAAHLTVCPTCSNPLAAVTSAKRVVGFRLVALDDGVEARPAAIAVALPIPRPEHVIVSE